MIIAEEDCNLSGLKTRADSFETVFSQLCGPVGEELFDGVNVVQHLLLLSIQSRKCEVVLFEELDVLCLFKGLCRAGEGCI